MWDSAYHSPVMVAEVLRSLAGEGTSTVTGQHILDGTLGGGGHSAALLAAGASVDGVDRDPEAVTAARERLSSFVSAGRFRAFQSNFSTLDLSRTTPLGDTRYDGVVLDLGVSSHQIDDAGRGFSFREGAPLDMRMGGPDDGDHPSAADWLNTESESVLAGALREYGDEPRGAKMARAIVRRRARRPFVTSDDLIGAIRETLGPRSGAPDFARLFQAVRIAVNHELSDLEAALPALRDRLRPNGHLVVIAYHSGEDRVVKHLFRTWSTACTCPPLQPQCTCGGVALGTTITRRPLLPTDDEIAENPRARSAKMRVWQRGSV